MSGLAAGRVLNRFAKDIGQLDSNLPWTFTDFVQVRTDLTAEAWQQKTSLGRGTLECLVLKDPVLDLKKRLGEYGSHLSVGPLGK